MKSDLSQTAASILHMINGSPLGTDINGKFMTLDLLEHHFGEKRMEKVQAALEELIQKDFIENVEEDDDVVKLTPYGSSYLKNSSSNQSTIFSNISNSNIAHKSSNVSQTINLRDLAPDIQEKIKEFDEAAAEKNPSKLKAAFGYIADKAVDVAIALAAGTLIR